MTDVQPPDDTDRLLRGTDAPRPLPPALRQRLVDQLLDAELPGAELPGGGDAGSRPLPQGLRDRLQDALPGTAADELPGERREEPVIGAPAARRWRAVRELAGQGGRRWAAPGLAAAAVVLVAALVTIGLRGAGGNSPPTVAAGSAAGGPARTSAGTSSTARDNAPRTAAAPSGSALGSAGSSSAGATNGGAGPAGAPGTATGTGPGAGSGGAAASPQPEAPGAGPVVTGISPGSGPAGGGTWVLVTGSHLGGATAVRFATSAAASFSVVSDTELRVLTPPRPAGTVDVTVVTGWGTSPTSGADLFTYMG